MDNNTFALLQMFSLGLLFLMFATKAYRRSSTLAIDIVFTAIAVNCFFYCKIEHILGFIIFGHAISLMFTLMKVERKLFYSESNKMKQMKQIKEKGNGTKKRQMDKRKIT